MAREGRKFKICSSCMLLIFTFMIIYFGETTVRKVKEDIEQWSEDELAKKLIASKINREYNLKKALNMRDHFFSIYQLEVKKYHSQALDELSEDALNSIAHVVKEQRIWDAIVTASFKLRGQSKDLITKQEWDDTIEYFSYSITEQDEEKARKDQRVIFNKISEKKKSADSITLVQYKKALMQLNLLLKERLIDYKETDTVKYPTGEIIFKYLAYEIALYHDCHRQVKVGEDINYELTEKCYDKKQVNKFLNYVIDDKERWLIVAECIFSILDVNSDNSIDATEIDTVLLELEFKDVAIRGVQEALIYFYDRNNKRVINHSDFLQVMERIRDLLKRYEEEMETEE